MAMSESKGNPPELATLNFGESNSDLSDQNFDNEVNEDIIADDGMAETEVAINKKLNNDLPIIPNYTKNPELLLENTVKELKGNGNLDKFKKDVPIPLQKPQTIIKENTNSPDTKEVIKKHMEQINDIGRGPPVLPPVGNPEASDEIKKNSMGGLNCKFLNSQKCHPDFPHFSGASIGFEGGVKMKCDSAGTEVLPKAVCTISRGKITGVYLINKGSGMDTPPLVETVGGGGTGAKFEAVVRDGLVEDVKVLDGGEGFHETPQIKFQSPNMNDTCYLCCK